jgi:plasmid stability protein
MPSLLIKDLPAALHRRLKEAAERHRRSMVKEAVVALERGIEAEPRPLPQPVRPTVPLTQAWLTRAIHSGRA